MNLEINYDRIRNAGDHVMPIGWPSHDQDGIPVEVERIDHQTFGTRLVDRQGNRFLLMGYGGAQGTYVLRDRHRAMFYVDGDLRLKVAKR